jgi:hypothetical protein
MVLRFLRKKFLHFKVDNRVLEIFTIQKGANKELVGTSFSKVIL